MAITPYHYVPKQPLKQWYVDQYVPLPIDDIDAYRKESKADIEKAAKQEQDFIDTDAFIEDQPYLNEQLAQARKEAEELSSTDAYLNRAEYNRKRQKWTNKWAGTLGEVSKQKAAKEEKRKIYDQLSKEDKLLYFGDKRADVASYIKDSSGQWTKNEGYDSSAEYLREADYLKAEESIGEKIVPDVSSLGFTEANIAGYMKSGTLEEVTEGKINQRLTDNNLKRAVDASQELQQRKKVLTQQNNRNPNIYSGDEAEALAEQQIFEEIREAAKRKIFEKVNDRYSADWRAQMQYKSQIGKEEKVQQTTNPFASNIKEHENKEWNIKPSNINSILGITDSPLIEGGGQLSGEEIKVNYANIDGLLNGFDRATYNTVGGILNDREVLNSLKEGGLNWEKAKAFVFSGGADSSNFGKHAQVYEKFKTKMDDLMFNQTGFVALPLEDYVNLSDSEKASYDTKKKAAEKEATKVIDKISKMSKDTDALDKMNNLTTVLKGLPQAQVQWDTSEKNAKRRIDVDENGRHIEVIDMKYNTYLPVSQADAIELEGSGLLWDDSLADDLEKMSTQEKYSHLGISKTMITNKKGEEVEVYSIPGIKTFDPNSNASSDREMEYNQKMLPAGSGQSYDVQAQRAISANASARANKRGSVRDSYMALMTNEKALKQFALDSGSDATKVNSILKDANKTYREKVYALAELEISKKGLNAIGNNKNGVISSGY